MRARFDQVADQGGQLLQLAAYVAEQSLVVGRIEAPAAGSAGLGEQVEVGAQAGQRRTQLVAGVRDQLPLPLPRVLERPQHRVEAGGEPGELVTAGHRYRAQILGGGDVLGGRGQPFDRAQAGPRDRETGCGCDRDTSDPDHQHHDRDPGQFVIGLRCRLGEHQRAAGAVGDRHRDDAVTHPVRRRRPHRLGGVPGGHLRLGLAVRRLLAADDDRSPVGRDEREPHIGTERQQCRGDALGELRLLHRLGQPGPGGLDRASPQVGVEVVVDLVPHRQIGGGAGERDGQAHRGRYQQGDPCAQTPAGQGFPHSGACPRTGVGHGGVSRRL